MCSEHSLGVWGLAEEEFYFCDLLLKYYFHQCRPSGVFVIGSVSGVCVCVCVCVCVRA